MRKFVVLCLVSQASLLAQSRDTPTIPAVPPRAPAVAPRAAISDDRIFGLIPNFQTVEDPQTTYAALTAKQKFTLASKSTFDPFNFFGSALGAAESHINQSDPKYGQGKSAYFQRYGAAFTDMASQTLISAGVLAPLFHEDPRYFRLGPRAHFIHRVGYSLSRVVVNRADTGKNRITYSSLLGTTFGIGLSNVYYPASSRTASEFGSRLATSFLSNAVSNLLPEFWPDIREKYRSWRH